MRLNSPLPLRPSLQVISKVPPLAAHWVRVVQPGSSLTGPRCFRLSALWHTRMAPPEPMAAPFWLIIFSIWAR